MIAHAIQSTKSVQASVLDHIREGSLLGTGGNETVSELASCDWSHSMRALGSPPTQAAVNLIKLLEKLLFV